MKLASFIRRLPAFCLVAGLIVFAGLCVDIIRASSERDDGQADAAIVLGAAVWGERLSPVFEERVNHAVDLYLAGRVRALILTGGKAEGNRLSDSVVASRYAMAHGVPAHHVFCEQVSRITHDNLRAARQIVEARRYGRVLLVSDPLHMRRSIAMARGIGLDAHSSPTPTTRYTGMVSRTRFLFREAWYYGLYLIERVLPAWGKHEASGPASAALLECNA